MPSLTPPMGASGQFTVRSPWTVAAGVNYKVIAIRSFQDIYNDKEDVFATYYAPMSFSTDQFALEAAQQPNIVTLAAVSQNTTQLNGASPIIHVPDNYISSFPNQANVPYSHVVLACDMGAIPDSLDVTPAVTAITQAVLALLGINATVQIFRAPTAGFISQDEHDGYETSRIAQITGLVSDAATVLNLQHQNNLLTGTLGVLKVALNAHNISVP